MDERKEYDDEEQQEDGLASKIWNCGSPLYDSYELVSIAHVLDMHQMTFPYVINRSASSVIHPLSHSRSLTVSNPSRKMNSCSFMPSFKLWKIKINNRSKVKGGISKICQRIVSWRK
ncbi:hypothetical protein LXL04_026671 [Taraxacum kok-saghyz]